MAEEKKNWTPEEVCRLIEAFREHPNLWDAKNFHYKNRIEKNQSYKELAAKFNATCNEVERKIRNVVSQYHRERRKYKKMKKSGAGHQFRAKWFGYNAMSFLHEKNPDRKDAQIIGADLEDSNSSDDSNSSVEETDIDNEGAVENTNASQKHVTKVTSTPKSPGQQRPFKSTKKICSRSQKDDTNDSAVFDMLKTVLEKSDSRRDEQDLFGEMVAHNLKCLKTEYAKLTVQNRINNLLYEARLGWYDLPPDSDFVADQSRCSANSNLSTTLQESPQPSTSVTAAEQIDDKICLKWELESFGK